MSYKVFVSKQRLRHLCPTKIMPYEISSYKSLTPDHSLARDVRESWIHTYRDSIGRVNPSKEQNANCTEVRAALKKKTFSRQLLLG